MAKQQPLRITYLTLRDGHQSLFATRMNTDDMLPIAEKMDSIGFYSMEVWAGATFYVMTRFLNENPWDRVKLLFPYLDSEVTWHANLNQDHGE